MEVFHFETAPAQSLYCCTFNGGDEPEMPACALKFSTTDVTLLVCSAGGETCLCQIDTMNDCSSMGCPARLQFNGFSGEAPTLIACQTAAQWVVRRGCSVEVGVASVSLHFAPQLTFTRIDRLPCSVCLVTTVEKKNTWPARCLFGSDGAW